jgi:DNA-binding transcriptional MerR regulator
MEILLMTGDAARILKRSEQRVRQYHEAGKLPAVMTANGRRLFKQSDVERLARELAADHDNGAPIPPQAA